MNSSSDGHGRMPTFVVIGAMKCGTTSLYHYLKAHPEIFMSSQKELDFFTAEVNWSKGLRWYQRQFSGASQEVALGEASTTYTKFPRHKGVPERMGAHLPEARLIYMVRHPVERIRSHYLHRVSTGAERVPIDEAVLTKEMYVDFSRYALQLEQYLPFFPIEQIRVVTAENLRTERLATLGEIFSFLGVDPEWSAPEIERTYLRAEKRGSYPRVVHKLRHVPAGRRVAEKMPGSLKRLMSKSFDSTEYEGTGLMSDAVKSHLEEAVSNDVRRLRTYMPTDFDGWGIA